MCPHCLLNTSSKFCLLLGPEHWTFYFIKVFLSHTKGLIESAKMSDKRVTMCICTSDSILGTKVSNNQHTKIKIYRHLESSASAVVGLESACINCIKNTCCCSLVLDRRILSKHQTCFSWFPLSIITNKNDPHSHLK